MDRRSFVLSSLTGITASTLSSAIAPGSGTSESDRDLNGDELFSTFGARAADVTRHGNVIRYISGNAVYVEELISGMWSGRFWGVGQSARQSPPVWTSSAFEIWFKSQPSPCDVSATLSATGWHLANSSEVQQSEGDRRHYVVELTNSVYPLKLKLHTLLDGTPVFVRWLEITNISSKPWALTALAPWSGRLWNKDAKVKLGRSLRWDDQWNGWFGWTPLQAGRNVIPEIRGLAYDDPYFVLHNEARGEYFFGQLAWPVNYQMEFDKVDGVTFKIGPAANNALRVIAPGETIGTPEVHLGCLKGGFDTVVQAMHDHIRRSVLHSRDPQRAHLIQYLFPEDQPLTVYHGADYNEVTVKECIDVAAAAGVEVFIVDGPTWCKTYGDWLEPDRKRFPNGLGPLREYAHQKGLLFGLYFELEGGRKGYCSNEGQGVCIANWKESEVFKHHPEWFVQPNYQLNLAIPEAAAYFKGLLRQVVEHYKLDLYRHDFNTPLQGDGLNTVRDGFTESNYWRHYEAFYDAFREIRQVHPQLILQQASAGGLRLDLRTCSAFDEQYTCDRVTSPWVYQMSSGISVYLPPEVLVTPNGMAGHNQPDFLTVLRATYFLGNTPFIFNGMLPKSMEEFPAKLQKQFQRYTTMYKTFVRPMLPNCKVWHHAPVNAEGGIKTGDWFAMEFGSPDQKRGWATIIRLANASHGEYSLCLKGVASTWNYNVTSDNAGASSGFSGSELRRKGLPIRLRAGQNSEVLLYEATT
jgi:alpha-galactosidase